MLWLEELNLNQADRRESAGCTFTLLNQRDGNLALVQAGGCRLAMAAGQIHLSADLKAHVYLGGYANPYFLSGARVLTTTLSYDWLDSYQEGEIIYSQGTPYLEIRPGRSLKIWKGEDIFG